MFWLGIFYGSLTSLHVLLYMILWLRKKELKIDKNRSYGPIIFPRFQIYLLLLGLPSLCEAATALVKGGVGKVVVGILLLGTVFLLLLGLLLFFSIGIIPGKLFRYKEEDDQEGCQWCQEIILAAFGPGKKGEWTLRKKQELNYITMFGPLFEELRGPPDPINPNPNPNPNPKLGESIIDSANAEATFIQKLFETFRIYHTLLDAVKKVAIGIDAGAKSENSTSQVNQVIIVCITAFQLLFMVLTKPLIERRALFVEIFTVFCELGILAANLALPEKQKDKDKLPKGFRKFIGLFMILLFLLPFLAQSFNEWYSLFRQAKELDQTDKNFWSGMKNAFIGFMLFFVPRSWMRRWIKDFDARFPFNSSGEAEVEGGGGGKGEGGGEGKGEGEGEGEGEVNTTTPSGEASSDQKIV